jgi:hypothetical protein
VLGLKNTITFLSLFGLRFFPYICDEQMDVVNLDCFWKGKD